MSAQTSCARVWATLQEPRAITALAVMLYMVMAVTGCVVLGLPLAAGTADHHGRRDARREAAFWVGPLALTGERALSAGMYPATSSARGSPGHRPPMTTPAPDPGHPTPTRPKEDRSPWPPRF